MTFRITDDHSSDDHLDDRPIDTGSRRLARALGVYTPQGDTELLATALDSEARAGDRVLELCAGSGAIAVRAARRRGTAVTALDVSRSAVLITSWAARRARVPVRTRRGDLFDPVAGERFDLVVANPPYVPARETTLPTHGRRRAWDGGTDGRVVIERICREVLRVLAPAGRLLLVQSEFARIDMTTALLRSLGLDTEVVARCEQPFGPVLTRRAAHLERAGLLTPGRRREELAVLRAQA